MIFVKYISQCLLKKKIVYNDHYYPKDKHIHTHTHICTGTQVAQSHKTEVSI